MSVDTLNVKGLKEIEHQGPVVMVNLMRFRERSLDGDVVKDFNGVKVVTDRMSAPYLGGASVDFVDTIEKQGFTIDNPNATGSCACGDSFS